MEVLFERVAGLDGGMGSVTVCVRTPGARASRHSETRSFSTMTRSLRVMRDWLLESGVTIAAIESTAAYWKPPFYCLEEGLEVWRLNAAHVKAVPGRQMSGRRVDCAFARARPVDAVVRAASEIRRLRMRTRHRVQLYGDRTRESVPLELMFEDASIKLSALSSINTSPTSNTTVVMRRG